MVLEEQSCQFFTTVKNTVVSICPLATIHTETQPIMNFSGLSLDCRVKNVEAVAKGNFMLQLQGKIGGFLLYAAKLQGIEVF